MTTQTQNKTVKGTFWTALVFYALITFEFFYMASPFAIYFYSVYAPWLNFLSGNATLAWLSSFILPHIVIETSNPLINLHNIVGGVLAVGGFLAFCVGACQVYYHKLARKGPVLGGVYNFIRHPQYAALIVSGLGMLLLWPRYMMLIMFVTMFFVYYFLALTEEQECSEKFGQSYTDYKNKTNMFLPFRVPLADKLPSLPTSGLKRLAAILALYVISLAAAIGLANGVKSLAVDSLYTVYQLNVAYVSVGRIDSSTFEKVIALAQADPEVQARLAAVPSANPKFINYVLPTEWNVSEIPMNQATGDNGEGHQYPADYNKNLYKVVFTHATMRGNIDAQGKDILLNTDADLRSPVVEVCVDLAQNKVVSISNPPAHIKYEGVPVPVY
jgi:protein-S-isoprenylcysteine O-methyltransferase Ste14